MDSTKPPLIKFSSDGKYIAVKKSAFSNLILWSIYENKSSVVGDESIISFTFTSDCNFLILANKTGTILILNLTFLKIEKTFEKLTSNVEIQDVCCFRDHNTNFLATVDVNSNIYISNIDKNIQKLKVFDKSQFLGENANLSLKCVENYKKSQIICVFENYIFILNTSSGKVSNKVILPCVVNSELLSLSCFEDNLSVMVDGNMILKYTLKTNQNNQKSKNTLTATPDLIYKKKFLNNINNICSCYDNLILVSESDGSVSILKSQKSILKLSIVEPSNQNIQISKKSKTHKAVEPVLKKINILLAVQVLADKVVLGYGNSLKTPIFELFSLPELIASSKNGKISIIRSSTNSQLSNKINSSVPVHISSTNFSHFDEISNLKRKSVNSTENEITTIGDTLDERLNKDSENSKIDKTEPRTDINKFDKSITLTQALHSENKNALVGILCESEKNPEIMVESLKNLPKDFLSGLLGELGKFLKNERNLAKISMDWIYNILKLQPNYILSNSSKNSKYLTEIHNTVVNKNKYIEALNKLNSRINYFLKETSVSSSLKASSLTSELSNLDINSNRRLTTNPECIYEADNDHSDDSNSTYTSSDSELEESNEEIEDLADADGDLDEANNENSTENDSESASSDNQDINDRKNTKKQEKKGKLGDNNNSSANLDNSQLVEKKRKKSQIRVKFNGLNSPSSSFDENVMDTEAFYPLEA